MYFCCIRYCQYKVYMENYKKKTLTQKSMIVRISPSELVRIFNPFLAWCESYLTGRFSTLVIDKHQYSSHTIHNTFQ